MCMCVLRLKPHQLVVSHAQQRRALSRDVVRDVTGARGRRYEVTKARPRRQLVEEVGMSVLASTLLVRTALAGCVVRVADRNPCPHTKLGRLTQHGTSTHPTLHAAGLWPLLPAAVVRRLRLRRGAGEPLNATVQHIVADIHCMLSALHVGLQLSTCVLLAMSADSALRHAEMSMPPHTPIRVGNLTLPKHLVLRKCVARPDLQINISRKNSRLTRCLPSSHRCARHKGKIAETGE